jgi:hypothetical protein
MALLKNNNLLLMNRENGIYKILSGSLKNLRKHWRLKILSNLRKMKLMLGKKPSKISLRVLRLFTRIE